MRTARSCLILGAGRSGTSLLAGMLRSAGYEMGYDYIRARPANPRGFFEDREVNRINELLLAPHSSEQQRWLAALPVGTEITSTQELDARIAARTATRPFCFKDPRFCYTLPAWRPYLGDAAFLCVFREPARTADSIARECLESPGLVDVSLDPQRALAIWTLSYRHVLERHRFDGDWLFLHYEQLLDGSAAHALEDFLAVTVDRSFAEPAFSRARGGTPVSAEAASVYEELCRLAGYRPAGLANIVRVMPQ
jgi:hypothetical protein